MDNALNGMKICLVVSNPSQFPDMVQFAKMTSNAGAKPAFFFNNQGHFGREDFIFSLNDLCFESFELRDLKLVKLTPIPSVPNNPPLDSTSSLPQKKEVPGDNIVGSISGKENTLQNLSTLKKFSKSLKKQLPFLVVLYDLLLKVRSALSPYRIYHNGLRSYYEFKRTYYDLKASYNHRHTIKNRFKVFLIELIWSVTSYLAALVAIKVYRHWKDIALVYGEFLDLEKPKLLIFAEDSVDYLTPELVRESKKRNIPSVVFPYSLANEREFIAGAVECDRFVRNLGLYKIIRFFWPRWIRPYKGQDVLKSEPYFVIAAQLRGVAPPNPWVMNSGQSNCIAVDSEAMFEYYRKSGIPSKQMQITGYPSNDELALGRIESLKTREKLRELGLIKSITSPLAICALPVRQASRALNEFEDHDSFLNFYVNNLKEHLKGWEIVYKIHPRQSKAETEELKEKFGIRGAPMDTTLLIPAGNLYLAAVSATIRWALACGIPAINYDVYNYCYDDFDTANGVTTVFYKKPFIETLVQHNSPEYLAQKTQVALSESKHWGSIDGYSQGRIATLFKSLILKQDYTESALAPIAQKNSNSKLSGISI